MNVANWNVCVIEPNKFERQIIVDLLRNAGVDKIKTVTDGDVALDMLEALSANIIIAAFELPNGDAAAWTRTFRRNRKLINRKASVFITSGAFSLSMAEQCRHAGANALIGKPLSAKVLIATINKVLLNPREFIDGEGYVGPCRRAGIVTAGAPKKRRQNDAEKAAAAEAQTLADIVSTLVAATIAFGNDAGKADACEAALRHVQAYAVNAGDGPLMRACAAFTLQIKSSRTVRTDVAKAALLACAQGVSELAALAAEMAEPREGIAERVRESVAKAALQRAA